MAPTVAEILADPKAQSKALWLTGLIGGIQMVDPVVASLALPKAGKDLGMNAQQLALAASVSTLFLAASVVLMGSLAERHGRRRMLILCLILAIVGDLVVVVAPATPVYMLGRAIAGIGVGGALACSYAYVRVVSPDERLGKALGFWAAVNGIVAIPMSLVGAGLANVNWRLAFILVPVVCLYSILMTPRILPLTPKGTEHRQLVGVILAGLGVVGILYGISQAAKQIVSAAVGVPILIGIVLLIVAGIIGHLSKNPSYPVWVFKDPGMIVAALAGALWNLCLAVAILQTSNLWQYVDQVAPFSVSVLQVPANIAVAVGSFVMGRLMSRGIDFRILMFVGFLIAGLAFFEMGATSDAAVSVWFNIGLTGVGLGAGAAGTVQSQVLLDAAPPGYLSSVAASRTTFGQMGYAIGLAGSAVVTTLFAISGLAGAAGGTDAASQELNSWLIAEHGPGSPASPVGDAYRSAFAQSMTFWTIVVIVVALVCAVLLTFKKTPEQVAAEVPHPST